MPHIESQLTSAAPAAHRSCLYALLSAAVRYPSAQFAQALSSGQLQARAHEAVAGLPYPLAGGEVLASPGLAHAALQEAYTHLFDVGSVAGPPCCLYEGEYGGGRMGVMEDLLRFYHFFGLRRSPKENERPDHLATELEFLHYLSFQEARAIEQGDAAAAQSYQAAARDFLTAHTLELTQQVAARLGGRTMPFYPGLVRLAAEFCAQDLQYLAGAAASASPPNPPAPFPAREGREGSPPRVGEGPGVGSVPASPASLELQGLWEEGTAADGAQPYNLRAVRAQPLKADRIVKATHLTNCWYQRACNFNLFVSDGVVLREEQVPAYPAPNDPAVPDANPRGCQKGVCYAHRTYDPARVKYPLKRVGERGGGRWQRLSWDQALTEIADGMLDVLTTEGPDTIIQAGGTRVHSQASEGRAYNALFEALGCSLPLQGVDIGDDHQGAAITLGKVIFSDSADNWFHSDLILVWGCNPVYTNTPNYHYIAEARYRGARVIAITPDYSPSSIHADLWVPINIGTDAALALSMAQVIIREGLYQADFVREQTDLPLLVVESTGKFLREQDLKRGGREDIFYLFDQASGQVVEVPRKSLALNGLVPALEGTYEVQTLQGRVRVRPVFELLRERLNTRFTPQQASAITGVPVRQIEALAREFAATPRVINITAANWGKFYHGGVIERAIILDFALCGHMGGRGNTYNAFPLLVPDTGVGAWERQGHQRLQTAAGADPRYAAWKEDGYTNEMILYEYARQAIASGAITETSLVQFFHGGLFEQSERYQSWDPYLKRPLREYADEAFDKGWQVVVPPRHKQPRILFQVGGNLLKRGRSTNQLLKVLWPKLKLVVTVDWRMSGTGLYSDYILPACGWYERVATSLIGSPQSPFFQVSDKAVDPLYDSLGDWTIFVRLARTIQRRARERGIVSYLDKDGKERRLDRLEDAVTSGGLYDEDDAEGVARDTFVNSSNADPIGWEEFKERGIAAYTSLGTGVQGLGNACDIELGEPIVPGTWHVHGKQSYPTLTRRMQFYLDHDWYIELDEHLPTHKDPPKAGGDYPLQVTGGHARWTIHTDWIDDAILLALQRGEPAMFISAQDAAARSVQDGDYVEVHNDVGGFRVQAVVSPAVRPGQVIIYHAWENYQFQGWRHFKSVMASPLNPIELAGGYGHIQTDVLSLSAGPNDRASRVEVRKAD